MDTFDPVVVLVHLAMPRPEFTDRGKSALALPSAVRDALATGITVVTKTWTTLKRRADRDNCVRAREREHWRKMQRREQLDLKEAADQVMETAYRHASGQRRIAHARQIMYAARPLVLEITGGKCWKDSQYFTQTLLPNFMRDHPDLTADWDVVFDDRGHLSEPHTGHRIGLGTLAVRGYIRAWEEDGPTAEDSPEFAVDHDYPTRGPGNRYEYVLFIEKEGFNPLIAATQIAERYDLALMSTKGMSVTAARQLVEALSEQGVTIFVVRDFDKYGFSIAHKLQSDTRRYQFTTPPNVVDLGLRLADVQALQLQSEPVWYDSHVDPRHNLRQCGATEAECNFLVQWDDDDGWIGQRVELNAMTSDQFIDWLETKLTAAGVQKVQPDWDTLEKAYRRAVRQLYVQHAIDEALADLGDGEEIGMPDEVVERLCQKLEEGSEQSWDEILWDLVVEDETDEEDGEDSEDGESLT